MHLLKDNIELINTWKRNGERIVFTNGCFDILHVGHVDYLSASSELGDRLVVAVNTDGSIKRLDKGTNRPVNSERHRLQLIQALKPVSLAFLFDEDTPLDCVKSILPDVLVKGADYDPEETDIDSKTYIVGSKEVKDSGGRVEVIKLTEGFSTTALISKIKTAY